MTTLNGNQAINAIKSLGKAMHFDAGYKTVGQGLEHGNWKKAFTDNFYTNGELDYAKAAGGAVGGMIGLRAGMGALRGTFTDSNGNLDLPGVPFI